MTDGFQFGQYLKSGFQSYHWTPWKLGLNGIAALFIVSGIAIGAMSEKPAATAPEVSSREAKPSESFEPDLPLSGARPMTGERNSLLPRVDLETSPKPDETTVPMGPPAPPPAESAEVESSKNWSPTLLKNGFGFFVAFSIGFALRTLFRFSTFVIGAQLIVLIVLSAVGWIDIRWDVMGVQFEQMLASAGEQFESLETFIKGHIPTTAFSSAGLYTGLRKS